MHPLSVRRVAVLGAGVMGAQIAAHCVNAGVAVTLFDLAAPQGDHNSGLHKALQQLSRLKPAALASSSLLQDITVANYDDDLAKLADCDLVIEAIAERLDWKHDLYQRVAPALAEHALLVTNTSGLPLRELERALPEARRSRFCGVHFFNPPRYMPLVELIPGPATAADVLDRLESFLTTRLGKSVVRARDTPNFIGNRVGVFSLLATMIEAERHGLDYHLVDELTGARLGRAKSGTFRTADVVGLDTLTHVIGTMREQLPDDPFAAHFGVPAVIQKLLQSQALGQKSGAGFYRKAGRDIQQFDAASGEYRSPESRLDDEVARLLKITDPGERLAALRASSHPQARFVWAILRDLFHYSAVHLAEIADSARDVDLAMRGGFGYQLGPFELWQAAGWSRVAHWIQEDIQAGRALAVEPLPAWVTQGPVAESQAIHLPEGSWDPGRASYLARSTLPVYERQLFPLRLTGEQGATPESAGTTLLQSAGLRVWHLAGDGGAAFSQVLIASIHSKMHALGPDVVKGLLEAVDLAERDFAGMVIWSGEPPFSAGADLQALAPLFQQGGADAVEPEERRMQELMLRLRFAQVPVVAGVVGLALGGGCELALYADRRVAALESYLGLVEVGVGLIPGAGGLAFGARRAAELHQAAPDTDLLQFLKRFILQAAQAKVAGSALEAREMGYLRDDDPIVMHEREVLRVALEQVLALHNAGYRPPQPRRFAVVGRDGLATVAAQLVNLRDGGFISAHDYHLAYTLASVMCGGDVDPGSEVDEAWMMMLERRAFLSLLSHPKTQERILGMLKTGKPVRN